MITRCFFRLCPIVKKPIYCNKKNRLIEAVKSPCLKPKVAGQSFLGAISKTVVGGKPENMRRRDTEHCKHQPGVGNGWDGWDILQLYLPS